MANFEARGSAVFQLPKLGSMGFCVCVCDNGDDNDENQVTNAKEIARCLNQDDDLKDLATWLLGQKTLHLNEERVALLEGIINA